MAGIISLVVMVPILAIEMYIWGPYRVLEIPFLIGNGILLGCMIMVSIFYPYLRDVNFKRFF